jgi:hypothetical protein
MPRNLDNVSGALNHYNPSVTLRHYAHNVRKHWPAILQAGLGLDGGPGGKLRALSPPAAPVADAAGRSWPGQPADGGRATGAGDEGLAPSEPAAGGEHVA